MDHISEADADNDKCKLLNLQVPAIDFSGGGTHTADALKQAQVCYLAIENMCKVSRRYQKFIYDQFQSILMKARRHSKKIICLITDGFSNGEDPMPIADTLKADNVTIITFGIQSGNFAELHQLSSDPGNEHSFLLDSFAQFESLARKALHTGNIINHFYMESNEKQTKNMRKQNFALFCFYFLFFVLNFIHYFLFMQIIK